MSFDSMVVKGPGTLQYEPAITVNRILLGSILCCCCCCCLFFGGVTSWDHGIEPPISILSKQGCHFRSGARGN